LGQTDCNARALTPKDFKHVRATLEHLVALEVLEREKRPGRKAKWFYRKAEKLRERVKIVEGGGGRPDS
jgi:pyruvate/2-oxoacid:ferredoxin oxidoreductase alpha subunit